MQPAEADISVVMPVWGDYAGRLATEALESLLAQDLAARIVVVDNASDPPLTEMDGVDLMRSETRVSVGAARNLGLHSVATPYVVFWDADDVMPPGTLRHLRERIAGDPEVVAVAASILEGDPPAPHRWPRRWTYGFTRWRRAFALAHCAWSLFPSTGSTIMRTDAVRAGGGYADSNSGEDWVLGVSLAFRGRVVLDERPGRLYRPRPGSLRDTLRSPRQLAANSRAVRDRLREDVATPRSVKALLPAIAGAQLAAIYLVRPAVHRIREFSNQKRSGN